MTYTRLHTWSSQKDLGNTLLYTVQYSKILYCVLNYPTPPLPPATYNIVYSRIQIIE